MYISVTYLHAHDQYCKKKECNYCILIFFKIRTKQFQVCLILVQKKGFINMEEGVTQLLFQDHLSSMHW